jgi:hypothetical protein
MNMECEVACYIRVGTIDCVVRMQTSTWIIGTCREQVLLILVPHIDSRVKIIDINKMLPIQISRLLLLMEI